MQALKAFDEHLVSGAEQEGTVATRLNPAQGTAISQVIELHVSGAKFEIEACDKPYEVLMQVRRNLQAYGMSHAMAEAMIGQLDDMFVHEAMDFTRKKKPTPLRIKMMVTDRAPDIDTTNKAIKVLVFDGMTKFGGSGGGIGMANTINGTTTTEFDSPDFEEIFTAGRKHVLVIHLEKDATSTLNGMDTQVQAAALVEVVGPDVSPEALEELMAAIETGEIEPEVIELISSMAELNSLQAQAAEPDASPDVQSRIEVLKADIALKETRIEHLQPVIERAVVVALEGFNAEMITLGTLNKSMPQPIIPDNDNMLAADQKNVIAAELVMSAGEKVNDLSDHVTDRQVLNVDSAVEDMSLPLPEGSLVLENVSQEQGINLDVLTSQLTVNGLENSQNAEMSTNAIAESVFDGSQKEKTVVQVGLVEHDDAQGSLVEIVAESIQNSLVSSETSQPNNIDLSTTVISDQGIVEVNRPNANVESIGHISEVITKESLETFIVSQGTEVAIASLEVIPEIPQAVKSTSNDGSHAGATIQNISNLQLIDRGVEGREIGLGKEINSESVISSKHQTTHQENVIVHAVSSATLFQDNGSGPQNDVIGTKGHSLDSYTQDHVLTPVQAVLNNEATFPHEHKGVGSNSNMMIGDETVFRVSSSNRADEVSLVDPSRQIVTSEISFEVKNSKPIEESLTEIRGNHVHIAEAVDIVAAKIAANHPVTHNDIQDVISALPTQEARNFQQVINDNTQAHISLNENNVSTEPPASGCEPLCDGSKGCCDKFNKASSAVSVEKTAEDLDFDGFSLSSISDTTLATNEQTSMCEPLCDGSKGCCDKFNKASSAVSVEKTVEDLDFDGFSLSDDLNVGSSKNSFSLNI